MDRLIILVSIAILVWSISNLFDIDVGIPQAINSSKNDSSETFNLRNTGSQSTGAGVVIRILPDDNKGSRHQKFILKMPSGQTLLIAHNIDIAPRINSLGEGDIVTFLGVYANNSKGGVIHWTHRDPRGNHAGGWLMKNGSKYQ
jgi:hypothetical protein